MAKLANQIIFDKLFEAAESVTDWTAHRHAAAVVHRKKLIAIGKNQCKTHPMMLKHQSDKHKIYLHAEIDAIKKVVNQYGGDFLRRCDLYVLRLTSGGNVGMSKPCRGCQSAIDFYKIKGVYWT